MTYKAIQNSAAILLAFSLCVCAGGAASKRAPQPLAVGGCKLLDNPPRYAGKLVQVEGTLTIGFERSDLTFDCPGSLGLSLSLYPPDKRKFGFLTDKQSQDALAKAFADKHPGDNLMERRNRKARVSVVGLFRCHYDFPNCENISRHGDSSIVVKSVTVLEPDKP